MSSGITDFNNFSHGDLRKLLEATNSGDVMAASDPWRRASDTLKEIRTALGMASGDATSTWEGNTSNAFFEKMTKLANNVNNTAAYANDAANTLKMMSEAIDQAKHDMPEEPGFWDKVGNAISDTAQNAVGIQDDSTQIPIADKKKADAVAVMQTLANKYRTAVPVLKPPPQLGSDNSEVPPPDPTAAAAMTAFVLGSGLGAIGGYASAPDVVRVAPRATGGVGAPDARAPRGSTVRAVAPADIGIKGGVANPVPKAPQSVAVGTVEPNANHGQPRPNTQSTSAGQPVSPGSGTGLDSSGVLGVQLPKTALPVAPAGTTGVSGGAPQVGLGSAVGRTTAFVGGKASGGAFTGQEEQREAFSGRRAATAEPGAEEPTFTGEGVGASRARAGGSLRGGGSSAGGRRIGAVVGEGEAVGHSMSGSRKAFTEGGTGLGARGRAVADYGSVGLDDASVYLPSVSPSPDRKKKRKGERADYLVEDEETWASDEAVNPDVVE